MKGGAPHSPAWNMASNPRPITFLIDSWLFDDAVYVAWNERIICESRFRMDMEGKKWQ
jgi:hypothetical protein